MDYLTVSEAADVLQLSVPTIKRYIYEGKLKSTKLPGGQHRIARSETASWRPTPVRRPLTATPNRSKRAWRCSSAG
jgi:excisionase family DNA binding protein